MNDFQLMHSYENKQANGLITYDDLTNSSTFPFEGNIKMIQNSEKTEVNTSLPTVYCSRTNLTFIIDSGSNTSIISSEFMAPSEHYTDFALAANNTQINICGAKNVDIQIGNEICKWKFLIADIKKNIIGCDILKHFNFSYDFENNRLFHAKANSPELSKKERKINWEYVNKQLEESDAPECVKELLREFPVIIDEPYFDKPAPKRKVMEIKLSDDIPVRSSIRPLPF